MPETGKCLAPSIIDYTRVSDPHFFCGSGSGQNLHADPDPVPDPGGIRGRGLGVKGKNEFFFSFFHVSDDS